MKRRDFLKSLAAAAVSLRVAPEALPEVSRNLATAGLPLRRLGKTGETVTCLGLGGFHIGWLESEATAEAVIKAALEEGVRFFDTAESYGNGLSEERFGRHLTPQHRDDIFLMTKTTARDGDTARQHLEGSLRRMRTDRIDLWQLHALASPGDVDNRLSGGLLETALRAKSEGKVRHIGFTGHASPQAHLRMLENAEAREAFEVCLLPVNPVDAVARHSFVKTVLPALTGANYGVLAMKTLADGRFFAKKSVNGRVQWETDEPVVPGVLTIADCIHFALSLPVSVLITGAETPEFIREKAAMVRGFEAMDESQRLALMDKVVKFAEAGRVEYYKAAELRG